MEEDVDAIFYEAAHLAFGRAHYRTAVVTADLGCYRPRSKTCHEERAGRQAAAAAPKVSP